MVRAIHSPEMGPYHRGEKDMIVTILGSLVLLYVLAQPGTFIAITASLCC
jgi:hypothetical protein